VKGDQIDREGWSVPLKYTTGYSNQNSHVNYSELLQLEKDWGNSVSDHFNI